MVFVAVVWAAPATVVVAVQVAAVAQAAPTTSRVVVNHGMAELAVSLEPALLLGAIPVVRGLS